MCQYPDVLSTIWQGTEDTKQILAGYFGSKWRNAITATSPPTASSMNHLLEGGVSRTMQRSHSPNGRSPLATGHVEEVLRFARKLGMHSDPDQLLRALPSELYALLDCTATAVIHLRQGELSFHVVDGEGCVLSQDPSASDWPQEIWSAVPEEETPLVISLPEGEAALPAAARFFRDCGCESLCVVGLTTSVNRLGALCVGRSRSDAFSEQESALLSLVSHYAALAIEERFNFAQSELVRAQLEEERTKLRLVLDLNNSVVSNLELKEVLQAISPGMRKAWMEWL
jgi:formate hydrogenlyase transcriptional activator